MSKVVRRGAVLAVLAVAVVAGAWAKAGSTIQIHSANGVSYLTDSHGMTLYVFALDASGKSSCAGLCAKFWPAFDAQNLVPPGSLSASDFGTITRASGARQTTYMGWPLYRFAGDKKPGQTNGNGFKGLWALAAVPFYSVMVVDTHARGKYLVDGNGNTLYYFTKDPVGKSVCAGICARIWPPYEPSALSLPSLLKSSDFGIITRSGGSPQLAFQGHPLYTFSGDHTRGETKGYGFKEFWYTVDPQNFKAR